MTRFLISVSLCCSESEVIGAQRYHGTDVSNTSRVYGGRGFGYNYDPIGNRTSASETIGGETLVKNYAANELNQYTAIANPDAVGLRGDATNTAVVTVNSNTASRDTVASDVRPWHFTLEADNANGPEYTFASIVGVVNPPRTNEADIVSTTSGSVYAPPQNETLTYDDDGNLLSDGRFTYTWNGENRLVCAEEQVCPTNRTLRKVEYAYDHQGRMVWKEIKHRDAEAQSWEEEKVTSYLWDDFNIVAETTAADSTTNTTYNIWGLDLDGSMQGAGGVGGLLAVVKDSATFIPSYDANGNIMEYVSTDGTIAAHREYDPFGGTVVATGNAHAFTHWFSTKPWCAVIGLSEYQFRKYGPSVGRWLSRDPLQERGSHNLYQFVGNNPVIYIDPFGLFNLADFAYGAGQAVAGGLLWVAAGGAEVFTAGGATPGAIFLAGWGAVSIANGFQTMMAAVQDKGPPDPYQIQATEFVYESVVGDEMTPTGKTITRSVYYGVDFSTSCYSVFMSVSAVAKTFVMRNIFVGEAYYTTRGLRLTSVTSKIQFKAVYVGTTAGTIANATFDFYMLEQTATSAIKDLTSGSISSTTPDILNVTSTNSSSETFIYTK